MSVSGIPGAPTRTAPVLSGHKHRLFRSAPIQGERFAVAAGNNASPTTTVVGAWGASDAGVYLAVMETADNVSVGWFRLDNGGTITFVQDSGAEFVGVESGNGKMAIYNNSGVLTLKNRLGDGSTAVAAAVTLYRLTPAPTA